MFDASDEVYEYLLCSICPVHLSKEGLCYNPETNQIENRVRDWLIEPPAKGFLFPEGVDANLLAKIDAYNAIQRNAKAVVDA